MTFIILALSALAHAGELKFDSFSQVVFFLNTTSSTCGEILDSKLEQREARQDVTSRFFQIPNPALSYISENPNNIVRVSEINLELKSERIEGGSYTCSIRGKELHALFAKDAERRWTGDLSPGMALPTSNFCKALKCGGILFIGSGPGRVFTDLRVVGKEIDTSTGIEKPIEAVKKITIYNMN
jgi:hypothetical protein